MPPLRDNPNDIKALAEYFVRVHAEQSGIVPCEFTDGALAAMQTYQWPGNVRQLRNVVEWLMIMSSASGDPKIKAGHLPPEVCADGDSVVSTNGQDTDMMGVPLREAREMFERSYLELQVKRFGGHISHTAQIIEMERSSLHRKLKQLGLTPFAKQNDNTSSEDIEEERKTAQNG